MLTLPHDTTRLLIRVLACVILLNVGGTFALLFSARHESSALISLASTALGGLIGVLINPTSVPGKTESRILTTGDVTKPEVPLDVTNTVISAPEKERA